MKEIVLVMGFPASGKTTMTEGCYTDCYRINRDTVGGSLKKLAPKAREGVLRLEKEGRSIEPGSRQGLLHSVDPGAASAAALERLTQDVCVELRHQ